MASSKTVQIICHVAESKPGYLCHYLEQQGIPYHRVNIGADESLPQIDQIKALILLGAPVSVNGQQPWIAEEMALVRACHTRNIPVLGICFGAQLISKALGGEVFAAPSMQIGWHPVNLTPEGQGLFADWNMPNYFEALEWHEESFSLPPGAIPVFKGGCIENQGFVIGSCLAVQFHPEVSSTMVRNWVARYEACTVNSNHCIQHHSDILDGLDQRLSSMRQASNPLFAWWLSQLPELTPDA